jgi:hypothetical protein
MSSSDLSDFCVYYQDEDYKVCQLKGVSYLDAEKWYVRPDIRYLPLSSQ